MTEEEKKAAELKAEQEKQAKLKAEENAKAKLKLEADAKAESEKQIREANAEITRLCTAAGHPKLAVEFIKEGLSVDAAKVRLFDKTAKSEAIVHSAHSPDADVQAEGDEAVLLMRAAGKQAQDLADKRHATRK